MTNPIGRPKKDFGFKASGSKFLLWLMPNEIEMLENKAREQNVSKAEVIRRLIKGIKVIKRVETP